MNTIILANPNPYGRFGHATLNRLTAYLLSYFFDFHFLPIKYDYFAEQWNANMNMDNSTYSYKNISEQNFRKVEYYELCGSLHGDKINRTFDFDNPNDLKSTVENINKISLASKDTLNIIRLPFDQLPGKLLIRNKRIHSDIIKCCNFSEEFSYDIAIHIRRGDVNPQDHESWYIEDKVYIQLISQLSIQFSDQNIAIFTQLNSDGTEPLQELPRKHNIKLYISKSTWTNEEEISIFSKMRAAKVLIGGRSSFSQIANFLSKDYEQKFIGLITNEDKGFLHSDRTLFVNPKYNLNEKIDAIVKEIKITLASNSDK